MSVRAFSLIEMLVALAVAAGALTITGGMIGASLQARAAAIRVGDELDRVSPVRGAVARLLGDAMPAARRANALDAMLFDGDARSARWVAQSWGGALPAGLYAIEASVSADSVGSQLTVQVSQFDPAHNGDGTTRATETAPLPGAASFAYARREATGALRWQSTWSGRDGWPVAVAFHAGDAAPVIVALPQPGGAP